MNLVLTPTTARDLVRRAERVTQPFRALYPFEHHFHAIGDEHMHYVDEGPKEAPPVLCVHGNPSWSFLYRGLVQELSTNQRVIAVDHLGCGLSSTPVDYPYTLERRVDDLASLVEALDLQDATLVVHDWGGPIGLSVAARAPQRFRRLVVTNTAGFRSKSMPLRIAACRIPFFGRLAVQGLNGFARAATTMAVERPLAPEVKQGYLAPYATWDERRATHEFVRDIPMKAGDRSWESLVSLEQALATLAEKPALLAWGGRDWCFHTGYLDEWRARWPHAEVQLAEEAGHYLFEDAPERVLPWIREFVEREAR